MKEISGFYNPLHVVAVEDGYRVAMSRIYFENGYAYVSDGHILVKMFIEDISSFNEDDIKKFDKCSISAKAFKCLYKSQKHIDVIEDGFQVGEVIYRVRKEEKPPLGYEAVLGRLSGNEPVSEIGMDVNLLGKLGKVFNDNRLTFKFNTNHDAVIVKPQNPTLNMAIIMPFYI